MIYLAPLQGFTDYTYRNVYKNCFTGVDSFFIPYISIKNETLLKKHKKEILPENNNSDFVVPQVLVKNKEELLQLYSLLKRYNYRELNINMGCPYPMVTNRGKGSGLLPFPDEIDRMLFDSLPEIEMKVSVKLRSGLENEEDIEKVIEVLNRYELKEIIYHPRVAKQLYKGKVNVDLFEKIRDKSKNEMVYNGDICTLYDYLFLKERFPEVSKWMIGRGILMDPLLPQKISQLNENISDYQHKLVDFHKQIVTSYENIYEGDSHVLMKLKQFWTYFSYSFTNQHKVFKLIKKAQNIKNYQDATRKIFDEYS